MLNLVLMHFNSIKVQLRLARVVSYVVYNKFQFHKGTIKAWCKC